VDGPRRARRGPFLLLLLFPPRTVIIATRVLLTAAGANQQECRRLGSQFVALGAPVPPRGETTHEPNWPTPHVPQLLSNDHDVPESVGVFLSLG
jgi:hypothetical protein